MGGGFVLKFAEVRGDAVKTIFDGVVQGLLLIGPDADVAVSEIFVEFDFIFFIRRVGGAWGGVNGRGGGNG